jgi:hypothetical protein
MQRFTTAVEHMPNNVSAPSSNSGDSQEKMLSVSGKKKCSHCGEELGKISSENHSVGEVSYF